MENVLGKPPEEYKNPWLLITLAFGYLLVFLALIGLLGYIVASRGGIIFTYTDEKNNFYIVPSSINDQKVAIQGILIEKNNKAEACLTNNVKFLPSKQENFLKTERIDCIQWTCSDSPSILFKCPNFRPIMSDQP